jgi:hypothetical protein
MAEHHVMAAPRATAARQDPRGLPVRADVAWWGVVGAVITPAASPLGHSWGIRPQVLAGVGGVLALGAVALWLWVRRARPMPRAVVITFGAANLATAAVLVALASLRVLPLTSTGNGALWVASGIVVALGTWQLNAARTSGGGR